MVGGFLLEYAGQIGQNALFMLIVGYLVMEVRSQKDKVEKMRIAMGNKQSKGMCDKIHENIDKNFDDVKTDFVEVKNGIRGVHTAIDDFKDLLITNGVFG